MHIFIVLALFLVSLSVSAGEELLIGSWEGDDTASISMYGTLKISRQFIAWDKNNNYPHNCKLAYQIQQEEAGVVFEDQLGHQYVTAENSEFISYLLKITSDNCATKIGAFRLTFPSENELDMVEYDESGSISGLMHFTRKPK